MFIGAEALITPFWIRVLFSASSNNLVQALDQLVELFRRKRLDQVTDPLHRERTDLTDLDPGSFRQLARLKFEGQGKSSALRLACDCHCDDRARTLVEDIVAEDDDGTLTSLFTPANGIEIGPPELAPQYSGYWFNSSDSPSSAIACSVAGSSLAHSSARRVRFNRESFSSIASWIARLRLGKTLFRTRWSSCSSVAFSMLIATFDVLMAHHRYYCMSYQRRCQSPDL